MIGKPQIIIYLELLSGAYCLSVMSVVTKWWGVSKEYNEKERDTASEVLYMVELVLHREAVTSVALRAAQWPQWSAGAIELRGRALCSHLCAASATQSY